MCVPKLWWWWRKVEGGGQSLNSRLITGWDGCISVQSNGGEEAVGESISVIVQVPQ